EQLPATLPSRHEASGALTPRQQLRRRAADALTAQGLHEIVGWSFTGPTVTERLRIGDVAAVELANPMSSDQSLLRTTLLGSLLGVAALNRSRGAAAVRLFESGPVYLPQEGEPMPREPHHLGAVLMGAVRPPTWREREPRDADFYAAKGVLAGLLDTIRAPWAVARAESPEPFLHPGRSAQILIDGEPAGWLAEIHPLVAAAWELPDTVAGFELDLDLVALHAAETQRYEDLTSFPAVREDLAVVVDDRVTADQVLATVRRAGEPLLDAVEVFDVYRDPERIGAGKASLALRLTYRAPDRTLSDEDVAPPRRAIALALSDELDGRVRDA
ncbi:MAG TPA: hypothetical protein VGX45_05565, partial [Solirubrobacteraceae bacterium]|nr:hypothetical protein [Solirubrobacteraceae bacterium]